MHTHDIIDVPFCRNVKDAKSWSELTIETEGLRASQRSIPPTRCLLRTGVFPQETPG